MSKVITSLAILGRSSMNIKEVKDLIKVVSESDLSELELEIGDIKLKLVKKTGHQLLIEQEREPQVTSAVEQLATQQPNTDTAGNENLIEVTSPMVGTFYRAPSPTSDPFVIEGTTVRKGQALCIIE